MGNQANICSCRQKQCPNENLDQGKSYRIQMKDFDKNLFSVDQSSKNNPNKESHKLERLQDTSINPMETSSLYHSHSLPSKNSKEPRKPNSDPFRNASRIHKSAGQFTTNIIHSDPLSFMPNESLRETQLMSSRVGSDGNAKVPHIHMNTNEEVDQQNQAKQSQSVQRLIQSATVDSNESTHRTHLEGDQSQARVNLETPKVAKMLVFDSDRVLNTEDINTTPSINKFDSRFDNNHCTNDNYKQ